MPCLEGATVFPAPNFGFIDVPALDPIEFLLMFGSIQMFHKVIWVNLNYLNAYHSIDSAITFCLTNRIVYSYSRFFAFSSNSFFQNSFYLFSKSFNFKRYYDSSYFSFNSYLLIIFNSSSDICLLFYYKSLFFLYNPSKIAFYLFFNSVSLASCCFWTYFILNKYWFSNFRSISFFILTYIYFFICYF